MNIKPSVYETIHRLWDELSDFEVGQSDRAVFHLMESLCNLTEAWNAAWIGSVRLGEDHEDDPLQGWRVPVVQRLYAVAHQPNEELYKEMQLCWERREIDPSFLISMEGLGNFRYYSLRQSMLPEWFESPFYKHFYGSIGTYDMVFIGFPLNQDAESHFGFHSRKAFTNEEMTLLAYALRGIKWFHRQIMLSHGLLVTSSRLMPSERKVLQLLLTDASEKQIAERLGLAVSTTHQYVTGIFRKFGVRSRAGLMSLWLNRG